MGRYARVRVASRSSIRSDDVSNSLIFADYPREDNNDNTTEDISWLDTCTDVFPKFTLHDRIPDARSRFIHRLLSSGCRLIY